AQEQGLVLREVVPPLPVPADGRRDICEEHQVEVVEEPAKDAEHEREQPLPIADFCRGLVVHAHSPDTDLYTRQKAILARYVPRGTLATDAMPVACAAG